MLVKYEKGSHFKNTKDQNEDSRIERIVFLESKTLAAVISFLNRRENSSVEKNEATLAFDILQPLFRRVLAGQSNIGMTEHQFYEAVALWLSLKTTGSMPIWLLRYSMGRICSTSMTINSTRLLVERKNIENAERLITVKVESQEKRTKVTKTSSKQFKPSSEPLYGLIKEALKDQNSQVFRPSKEAKQRLKALLDKQHTIAEEIVVDWIIEEMTTGSWKAASTALRNASAVTKCWLLVCQNHDLESLDIEGITSIYEEILSLRENSDANVRTSLNKLLRFANQDYKLPLPESLVSSNSDVRVNNTIVSEHHFQCLINKLSQLFSKEERYIREAVLLMVILMRRLGLRPFEVVRLTVGDISLLMGGTLIVKRSVHGDVKTASSQRQIPLEVLLIKDEFKALHDFVEKRRNQVNGKKDKLLFSATLQYDRLFESSTFTTPVTQLLSAYSSEHTPCYQLRHSFASIMQIILFGDQDMIELLTPYSNFQANEIRDFFNIGEANDKLMQLSSVLGHLSPKMSLSTYAHHSDLLLGQACETTTEVHGLNFWKNLAGVKGSSIKKYLDANADDNLSTLSGRHIKLFLFSRLSRKPVSDNLTVQRHRNTAILQNISKFRNTVNDVCAVLRYHDKHQDDFLLYTRKHGLSDKWSDRVVVAAKNIKNHSKYLTSHGNSRLYPKNSVKLLPSAPASTAELEDVSAMWKRLNQLTDRGWGKLRKSIDYLFQNSLQQHSFVTFDEYHKLDQFISEMSKVVDHKSRWFKEIHGKSTIRLYYSRANIGAVMSQNTDYTKYSSNCVRYALHLYVIFREASRNNQ